MATFHHDNRSITYRSEVAPFDSDLLMLQSSRFNVNYWKPVMDDLAKLPPSIGRVIVCEWHDKDLELAKMSADVKKLIETLGLHTLHVVACGDAVKLIKQAESQFPGVFAKTLLYPGEFLPPADELNRAIRDFLQI